MKVQQSSFLPAAFLMGMAFIGPMSAPVASPVLEGVPPSGPTALTVLSTKLIGIPLSYAVIKDRLELYYAAADSPSQPDWMQFRPNGRELLPQTGIALADPAGIEYAVGVFKVTDFKPLAVDSTFIVDFIAADGQKIRSGSEYQPVTNFHYSEDGRHWAVGLIKGKYANKVSIIHDGKEVKTVATPLANKGVMAPGVVTRKNGALICSEFAWEWAANPNLRQMPITNMTLSPDGNRLAYVVDTKKPKGCYVVVDDKEGPGIGNALRDSLRFSPDGQHLAYVAVKVWDATAGPLVYDGEILEPVVIDSYSAARMFFSPDGRFLVIPTMGNRRNMDVMTGRVFDLPKRQFILDGAVIERMRFSPVGGKFMFLQKVKGGGQKVIGDNFESKVYGKVESFRFSPDGAHMAWIAITGEGKRAVLDGVNQAIYADVDGLSFSPDGKRFAYAAKNAQKKWMLVVDGAEWGPYDAILGEKADDHQEYYPERPEFFSPDGKRAAAAVRLGKACVLVIDGQPGVSAAKMGAPIFSPDGSRVAVWASDGVKEYVIVDGREMPKYDEVDPWQIVFGPDGRHIAYKAKVGKEWFPAIDEAIGAESFEAIITAHRDRTSFVFTAPDALYFVGLKNKQIFLSEAKIGS